MLATRFTDISAERAHDEWGCNCGPGAIAAIMGMTLDQVRPFVEDAGFHSKHYTNPTMMYDVLNAIGRPWRKIGLQWPQYGLVRIQWEGPWTEDGVPMRARYRHTHWIGFETGKASYGVFDINCINNGSGWVSLDDWNAIVVPWLTGKIKRAYGTWHKTHCIEVGHA